jgi:hypothetical protein
MKTGNRLSLGTPMTVYIPNGLHNELTGVAQALRISKATIVQTLLERFIVIRTLHRRAGKGERVAA